MNDFMSGAVVRSSMLCSVLLAASLPGANAGETKKQLPIEQALPILEALENRIQSVRWDVEVAKANLINPEDPKSVKDWTDYSTKGSVLFDPQLQRHRAEFESITKWTNGAAHNAGTRKAMAFDGDVYRRWHQLERSKQLPSDDAHRRGSISKSETERGMADGQFMQVWGPGPLGIAYMPPYFWTEFTPAEPVSKLLRRQTESGKPTTIDVQNDDTWIIHTIVPYRSGRLCSVSIMYDPSKGLVTGAEWRNAEPADSVVWKKLEITLREVQKGFWVPTEAREIYKTLTPATLTRITYSNVEVNPPVTAASFRIEFPPGTELRDFINNKQYTVGYPDKDQAKAVRSFMDRNAITGPGPMAAQTQSMRRWILWANIAVVVVLASVVLYRTRKNRPRKVATTGTVAILLASILVSSFQAKARAEETAPTPVEMPPVSRCGVDVCCFAFEYFGLKYNSNLITEGLNLTDEGASVESVDTMLRAHGLQTDVRQDVTISGLKSSLLGGNLAIFLLKNAPDRFHYYVAMLDQKGQPVIVNVLHNIRPFDEVMTDKKFAQARGLVIFTSRREDKTPLSKVVSVSPEQVDLGTVRIDTEGTPAINTKVTLHNGSQSPVMIYQIATSCGCAKPEWDGGILHPNQDLVLPFRMVRALLGAGTIKKQAFLLFPDDTMTEIKIVGTGETPQLIQGLIVTPEKFRLDLSDPQLLSQETLKVQATITGTEEVISKLSARSDNAWLHPIIKPLKADSAALEIEIRRDAPEIRQLGERSMEIEGHVLVTSDKDAPPIPVSITLLEKPLLVDPSFATVHRTSESPTMFQITAVNDKSQSLFELEKVNAEPKGLVVEQQGSQGAHLAVSVRATKESAPGLYVVNCLFQTPEKKRLTAKFVVNVVE